MKNKNKLNQLRKPVDTIKFIKKEFFNDQKGSGGRTQFGGKRRNRLR